ncbi:NADPh quinone reductase [Mortierella sp. AD032]|nr:NADPh quinone reductase [Mortierella sp. AD032]
MTDSTSHLPQTFKSIQWTTPSLNIQEILSLNTSTSLPTLTGSNILVKVHAAALNPVDWKLMRGGVPRLLMPKIKVPGLDISGTIVAVGPKVKKQEGGFKVGDEVVAMLSFSQSGALTEYTVVDESYLAKKPERWSHEQAAAWPLVATTVWQALVLRGNLKKGDKVLIVGASGGTGTVGVQIAKALGAYVVGVCSTDNVQLVKDLGADEVVDYKKEDVTAKYTNQDFDLIFDTVGSAEEIWAKNATILKPSGNLVRIAGPDNTMDTPFTFLQAGAQIGYNKVCSFLKRGPGYHLFTTFPDGMVLTKAISVLDEAHADPVIDSVNEFTLSSVLAAFEKSKSHRAKGKIVIKIA